MVFQSYALYPTMTVRAEHHLRHGEPRRAARPSRTRRSTRVAACCRSSRCCERKPGQLSGGQRQRVAMGRALVRDPKLFLFDEPLSNLDAKLRVEMRTEIKKLHQRVGKTTIYVTHDQVEAMTLASRIAVMHKGELQQFDEPRAVYDRPANMFVAGFMGSPAMNFIPAELVDAGGEPAVAIALAGGGAATLPLACSRRAAPARQTVMLGVRPEHLVPLSTRTEGAQARLAAIDGAGRDGRADRRGDDGGAAARRARGRRPLRARRRAATSAKT